MANEYDMRDAVALVAAELGDRTFTFNSIEFACAGGDIAQNKELAEGGFSPDQTAQLVVDASLSGLPGEQDVITYEQRGLRIMSVTTACDGSIKVYDCVDDSKGV